MPKAYTACGGGEWFVKGGGSHRNAGGKRVLAWVEEYQVDREEIKAGKRDKRKERR